MIKFATLCIGFSLGLCACASAAAIDMAGSIPEFASYGEVYRLNIPVSPPTNGWTTANLVSSGYSVNNAANYAQGSFSRIAYYMELSGSSNNTNFPNGWVWVSFDAAGVTNRADKTGVPVWETGNTGTVYQQNIANMTVYSNIPSIVTGTGIGTGNIEFWGTNYAATNTRTNGGPVPNAASTGSNNTGFDFGDSQNATTSGHGSMQIHNYDIDGAGAGTTGQTLFAYNSWGAGGTNGIRTSELGIGTNPNTAQGRDWTLTSNAASWTSRTLQVFVQPIPEPSWFALLGLLPAAWWFRRR